jgi:catechol 2,3-dioxygenase-like lactoylglutathione lyase family enzyme
MRIDDACLVINDVDVSDEFYSHTLGLERRMRNVRFADYVFAEGPRLAVWMEYSIAETVGETYPVGPGLPFRITLDTVGATPAGPHDEETSSVAVDPDGFVLQLRPSAPGPARMSAIELTVSDLDATAGFLSTLGFLATGDGDGSVEFATDGVLLTIRTGPLPPNSDSSAPPRTSGRLMLAIELETGDDVDRMFAELQRRGLKDSGPPRVYEWGSRSAYFVDADGYIWEIYAWVETPR